MNWGDTVGVVEYSRSWPWPDGRGPTKFEGQLRTDSENELSSSVFNR